MAFRFIVLVALSFAAIASAEEASSMDDAISMEENVFLGEATGPALPGLTTKGVSDGYESKGCYTDDVGARTLRPAYNVSSVMTPQFCVSFCHSKGYPFAGVEYSYECFCDNALQSPGAKTSDSECNFACTGDSTQSCGGSSRIQIYQGPIAPPPVVPPVVPPVTYETRIRRWRRKGCFLDDPSKRTLPHKATVAGGKVTPQTCTAACAAKGFKYAGTELGNECWCGNKNPSKLRRPDRECSTTCAADNKQICGGTNRLTVYRHRRRGRHGHPYGGKGGKGRGRGRHHHKAYPGARTRSVAHVTQTVVATSTVVTTVTPVVTVG